MGVFCERFVIWKGGWKFLKMSCFVSVSSSKMGIFVQRYGPSCPKVAPPPVRPLTLVCLSGVDLA